MASSGIKRKFATQLGASNTPLPALEHDVHRINAASAPWRDLADKAVQRRAVAIRHTYKEAHHGTTESLTLTHTHGEFKKKLKPDSSGDMTLSTHNIATSIVGTSARPYPKITKDLNATHGATDALRVLKGTHQSKGLLSPTRKERAAAVELAGEIGVSEYSRGTTSALLDASINLYRIKHNALTNDEFADPDLGYTGAGKGGAERLRKLSTITDVFDPYQAALDHIYETHASRKAVRPWEDPSASKEDNKAAWMVHKVGKWRSREV